MIYGKTGLRAGLGRRSAETPNNISLADMAVRLDQIAQRRRVVMAAEADSNYSRVIDYQNTRREAYRHRLEDLLLHVYNHAIHHRAQALNMLRPFGKTVPGGLDYLFFRLAQPTLSQSLESAAMVRNWKIECGETTCAEAVFDVGLIRRYFHYGSWAMNRVLEAASGLDDAALDKPFEMGMGSLRLTLSHVVDAEQWWLRNWTEGPSAFSRIADGTPLSEVQQKWLATTERRDRWLASQSARSLQNEVTAMVADISLRFRTGESLFQLCGHGTHHRAQAVNMLRHLGRKTDPVDYVVWVRSKSTSANE